MRPEANSTSLTFLAFMVADVTMSLRSRRLVKTAGRLQFYGSEYDSPTRLTLSQETHQDIGTERPLVSLVEDDDRVSIQIAFIQRLSEQYTIGHICQAVVSIRRRSEHNLAFTHI